ncbi:MAG: hypothetical protein P8099_18910, partial [Gemmatimonadota bacterium]
MRFIAWMSWLLVVVLTLLSPIEAEAGPVSQTRPEPEANATQHQNPGAEPRAEPDPVAVVRSMAEA